MLADPDFPCVVSRHDPDGACVAVTAAAARLLGCDGPEACGRMSVRAVHPGDRIRIEHALERVRSGEDAREMYRLRRRDGSWVWVDTRFRPLSREHGSDGFEAWSLDATDLRVAEEVRRQESRERAAADARFERLLDATADAVLLLDDEGRVLRHSAKAQLLLGRAGASLSDLDGALRPVHPEDRTLVRHAFRVAALPDGRAQVLARMTDTRGQRRLVAIDLVNVELEGGGAVLGTARDVTDRQRHESAVQTHARLLEQTIREAPLTEVFATVVDALETALPHLRVAALLGDGDPSGGGRLVTRPGGPLDGLDAPAVDASRGSDLAGEPADIATIAALFAKSRLLVTERLQSANVVGGWVLPVAPEGERPATLLILSTEPGPLPGDELALISPLVDLTSLAVERHHHQRAMAHAATHDQLTGLANRSRLTDHLHELLQHDPQGEVGVLYIDLDGFKELNDEHGHLVGDAALVEIGRRLQRSVRPGDLVARLGGDEFVVVLDRLDQAVEAQTFADRIAASLELPMDVAPTPLALGASIGVARLKPGSDPQTALREADLAMYEVKRRRTRPSTRTRPRRAS